MRISRSCSSACGPLISPSRLVSSNSKSKTASFGGSARAGTETNSISAAKAKSALIVVISDVDGPRNDKMRGCKLRQFGHVSNQKSPHRRFSRKGTSGGSMVRWLVGAIGLSVVATHALAAGPVEIGIGYLGHAGVKSKLSLVEQPSENDGIAGARLAIEDNNTTGRFLNQR